MKIVIKSLTGASSEFTLDQNANIRELRNKISSALGIPWEHFHISNIVDTNNNKLAAIYSDDSPDEKLVDFLRTQTKNPQLQIDELKIYVVLNMGPKHYRPTAHNPEGHSAPVAAMSNSNSAFFKSTMQPDPNNSFSERLKKIGITSVPPDFLDPITNEFMNDPVMIGTQRTLDITTLQRSNYIDPFSKQPISKQDVRPDLQLRSQMESFVSKKELEAKAAVESAPGSTTNEASKAPEQNNSESCTIS